MTQRAEINLQPCLSPQTPICMPQVVPHNRAQDFQRIDCVVMIVLRTDEKLAVLWKRWEMRQTHTETWGWPGIQRLQFDSSWFEPVRASRLGRVRPLYVKVLERTSTSEKPQRGLFFFTRHLGKEKKTLPLLSLYYQKMIKDWCQSGI